MQNTSVMLNDVNITHAAYGIFSNDVGSQEINVQHGSISKCSYGIMLKPRGNASLAFQYITLHSNQYGILIDDTGANDIVQKINRTLQVLIMEVNIVQNYNRGLAFNIISHHTITNLTHSNISNNLHGGMSANLSSSSIFVGYSAFTYNNRHGIDLTLLDSLNDTNHGLTIAENNFIRNLGSQINVKVSDKTAGNNVLEITSNALQSDEGNGIIVSGPIASKISSNYIVMTNGIACQLNTGSNTNLTIKSNTFFRSNPALEVSVMDVTNCSIPIGIIHNIFNNNTGLNNVLLKSNELCVFNFSGNALNHNTNNVLVAMYANLTMNKNAFQNPNSKCDVTFLPAKRIYQRFVINASYNWWDSTEYSLIRGRVCDKSYNKEFPRVMLEPYSSNSQELDMGMRGTDYFISNNRTLGGYIKKNVTLPVIDGTYMLSSNLTVLPNVTLVLAAGVSILAKPGVVLVVEGKYV